VGRENNGAPYRSRFSVQTIETTNPKPLANNTIEDEDENEWDCQP
jgi:hypothetical protein